MYKVLVFVESEVQKVEVELNSYKGWDFVHAWSTSNGRLVVILKSPATRGRPKKDETSEE